MVSQRQSLTERLLMTPKKMFFIGSMGALLSALLPAWVLAPLESRLGMAADVLYGLSAIACCYSLYPAYCYFFTQANWQRYLKIIAMANVLYGLLTIGIAVFFSGSIKLPALIYFSLELLVLSFLIILEWKLLAHARRK